MINASASRRLAAPRVQKTEASAGSKLDRLTWFCFLIGLFSYTSITIVGQLGVSDILVILALPFAYRPAKRYMKGSLAGKIFAFSGVYLGAQVLTDLWRATPPEDFLRGWAKIGIFTLALLVLPTLFGGKVSRIGAYIIGVSLGSMSQAPAGVFASSAASSYKFYVAMPLSAFAFLLVGILQPKFGKLAYLIPVAVGALSFLLNARSAAGMALMGAAVCLLNSNISARVLASPRKMMRRSLLLGGAIVVVAMAIVSIYDLGASSGAFGEDSQKKFMDEHSRVEQQTGSVFDTLLGGRYESLFAIPKIIESPIIGYGSWAKDKEFIDSRGSELHLKLIQTQDFKEGLIPSHSHFFGAWVEAGFIGAFFWAFAFIISAGMLLTGGYRVAGIWGPVLCLMFIAFCWSIPFSPFTGSSKMQEAALIVMLGYCAQALKSRPKATRLDPAGQ